MENEDPEILEFMKLVQPTYIKLIYSHYLGFELKDSIEHQVKKIWYLRLNLEKLQEGVINHSNMNEKIKRKLMAQAGVKYKVKQWWQFWR